MWEATTSFTTRRAGVPSSADRTFFVALGREETDQKSYVVWEEDNHYPDVIIELLSATTEELDRGQRFVIYRDRFKTPEYYWYHPTTQEFEGFRLVDGQYIRLPSSPAGTLECQSLGAFGADGCAGFIPKVGFCPRVTSLPSRNKSGLSRRRSWLNLRRSNFSKSASELRWPRRRPSRNAYGPNARKMKSNDCEPNSSASKGHRVYNWIRSEEGDNRTGGLLLSPTLLLKMIDQQNTGSVIWLSDDCNAPPRRPGAPGQGSCASPGGQRRWPRDLSMAQPTDQACFERGLKSPFDVFLAGGYQDGGDLSNFQWPAGDRQTPAYTARVPASLWSLETPR